MIRPSFASSSRECPLLASWLSQVCPSGWRVSRPCVASVRSRRASPAGAGPHRRPLNGCARSHRPGRVNGGGRGGGRTRPPSPVPDHRLPPTGGRAAATPASRPWAAATWAGCAQVVLRVEAQRWSPALVVDRVARSARRERRHRGASTWTQTSTPSSVAAGVGGGTASSVRCPMMTGPPASAANLTPSPGRRCSDSTRIWTRRRRPTTTSVGPLSCVRLMLGNHADKVSRSRSWAAASAQVQSNKTRSSQPCGRARSVVLFLLRTRRAWISARAMSPTVTAAAKDWTARRRIHQ
jgi:hypothetical protein